MGRVKGNVVEMKEGKKEGKNGEGKEVEVVKSEKENGLGM